VIGQPARPGRKRSEDSRLAIMTAAYELVVELGYPGLSIEGIAARSGTGKQTIYRWWPSKADVLLDALATKADLHIPLDDTGSWAGDLRAFLAASFRVGRMPGVVHILRTLMAQAQIDPEFGQRFRAGFLQRRREALEVLVERAAARGDLPAGRTARSVTRVVFGVIWYEVLAADTAADTAAGEELTEELVLLLAR
jgi:AcrR family transcriptional regulator